VSGAIEAEQATEADPPLHARLGLTDAEASRIESLLGRAPNALELAMYAVMWSEHCSYKSSRHHLRRLPSEGEGVLVGPGENAGVIDVGGGMAVALRIESHNHPSAVEPYQGAATGVGGIIRDVLATGARPVALLDSLRFAPLDDPRARWLLDGVVSGISGYGNSVGVPTVGGEVDFASCYGANPLVNVMCVGFLPRERLVLGRASGAGNLAVLLGASTGRDGIGGVSVLASAGFGRHGSAPEEGSKRPSVQVGDPFEEKRLIEACLELLGRRLAVGLQDLGGAGLTCAASETSARAGLGMDLNVAAVPRREGSMEPFEVMTSESQERMLAIVRRDDLEEVVSLCAKWDVSATVVGRVTPPAEPGTGDGRLRVLDGWDGPVLADVPCESLAGGAPVYTRPLGPPADLQARRADDPGRLPPGDCGSDLLSLLADPSWIYLQYDHQLFLNTVVGPGADAALLRLEEPGARRAGAGAASPASAGPASATGLAPRERPAAAAIALSVDGCSRWCALDPRRGAAMTVAESAMNVACVGAAPVALVDCLNFGNPEHPEVMWQLSEAIDGLSEVATGLGLPVVGGNVSLYNETGGSDIDPTPVVGTIGLAGRLERRPPGPVLVEGCAILLLGTTEEALGGSRWAALRGHRGGSLPALGLEAHRRLLRLAAELAGEGVVEGIHDVSGGGLAVALAEMAIGGGTGFEISGLRGHAELFSESPSRVVVCASRPGELKRRAAEHGVAVTELGVAGSRRLAVEGLLDLPLESASGAWRSAIASRMAAEPDA
jgi:phosphoribosylformylglycinamidine synthase II